MNHKWKSLVLGAAAMIAVGVYIDDAAGRVAISSSAASTTPTSEILPAAALEDSGPTPAGGRRWDLTQSVAARPSIGDGRPGHSNDRDRQDRQDRQDRRDRRTEQQAEFTPAGAAPDSGRGIDSIAT
jgi:hypothetical protein